MPDPVLNAVDCPCCDAKARVTPASGGSGSLVLFCGSCKFQGFAKSPRAVEGLKAKMNGPAPSPAKKPADPPTPAKAPAEDNWLAKL